MNYSFVFFLINVFFMLFLLRCFYGILFYFTCVGYFNLTYLGTLIQSFIWEENRNNFFRCICFHFFFHVCSCTSLRVTDDSLFIVYFFPYFFVSSKLNLITAFEVFFSPLSFLMFFFFFCSKRMYY